LLAAPARVAQVAAPLLFGFLIDRVGTGASAVSAGLGLASTASLLALHMPRMAADSGPVRIEHHHA
jgi:hypothetical protein